MKAIETLDEKKLTIGHAALGMYGRKQGTVKRQVHDGDTIIVRAVGNIGIRLLGIDTPEISFRLPGDGRFWSLSDQRWREFLADPFDRKWPPFDPILSEGLKGFLQDRKTPHAAENHCRHAKASEDALEEEVQKDMHVLGQDAESFGFFLAFAYEIMDGYGRFLCYVNREQPDPNQPTRRPKTYNERLLELGRTSAYFIWPNINPWRKEDSIVDAVLKPGTARTVAEDDSALQRARRSVQRARQKHLGIFDAMDPLILEPFEVRFFSRRRPPDRWVIDLNENDTLLIHPQNYCTVPHPEDRLFIPAEYVPLFVEKGWRKQALHRGN